MPPASIWVTVRPLAYLAGIVASLLIGSVIIVPKSDAARLALARVAGEFDESCSWSAARTAVDYEQRRNAARTAVGNKSTLVGRDGDLALIQTPFGPSWISGLQPLDAARFRAADIYHWPPRWAENPDHPLIGKSGVMIDGGGHIGESAATALKMGAARVISIEPDPVNAEAIRRNLGDAIKDGRLIVVQAGVWDSPGTLQLERGDASTMSETHVEAHGTNSISVPVTTIDDIVASLKLTRVDAIKLDIEGAEPNALRGARETLKRFKPKLAIGAYHNETDRRTIPAIITSLRPDYTVRATRCLPAWGRIQPHELFFE